MISLAILCINSLFCFYCSDLSQARGGGRSGDEDVVYVEVPLEEELRVLIFPGMLARLQARRPKKPQDRNGRIPPMLLVRYLDDEGLHIERVRSFLRANRLLGRLPEVGSHYRRSGDPVGEPGYTVPLAESNVPILLNAVHSNDPLGPEPSLHIQHSMAHVPALGPLRIAQSVGK